jgi:diguanylate cyclase (GGDEF)-like protein
MFAKTLRERLAGREDTEHVQALIRIGFGLIIAAYLYWMLGAHVDAHVFFVVFEGLSCGILGAIVMHPQRSAWRRAFGAVVDIGSTTVVMLRYGEIAAPLYGIYLWVTFGNGFRYGVRSLYASYAMSMAGFAAVVTLNPFWHERLPMTGGLLVTLAAVPPYGAILLKALERANDTLRQQAMRDVLTGLYNRRYLMEWFERELHRARRHKERLGVMMIDIDHFKRVNDTFGHAAGDEVLRSVARFMLRMTRAEDILCRFGGEEFVLVQTKASAEAILKRAEQLRQSIPTREIVYHGRRLGPVSLSIGVAMFPEDGEQAEEILRAADGALYRAKENGRNRVVMLSRAPERRGSGAGEETDGDAET